MHDPLFARLDASVTEDERRSAIAAIVEANAPLVLYLSKRFGSVRDREALIQSGMVALWRAVATFDCRKARFATYAGTAIVREFRRYCITETPTDRPAGDLLHIPQPSTPDVSLECLTEDERMVIRERYWGKKSLREIARERGVSSPIIHRLHRSALQRLKAAL